MSSEIRAFLAVRLPREVTASLARLIDQAVGRRIDGIRPVKPENMHLTIRFFGNVDAPRVEPLIAAIRQSARSIRPFTLSLGGVGAYPNIRNARVSALNCMTALRPCRTRGDGSTTPWRGSLSSVIRVSSVRTLPSRESATAPLAPTDGRLPTLSSP